MPPPNVIEFDDGRLDEFDPVGLQKPTAVVLVVHGLNLKPLKMMPLIQQMRDSGARVVLVGLAGHEGSFRAFQKVSRETWLKDLLRGYCRAKSLAETQQVPLYFLGYSLGALLGVDLQVQHPEIHFQRTVLLAPPLEIRDAEILIPLLKALGPEAEIPSANHKEYRANFATTGAAYLALLDSREHWLVGDKQSIFKTPTLLFVDPRDELVSDKGLMLWVEQAPPWRLVRLPQAESEIHPAYHHLIIDERSLGKDTWQQVQAQIRQHFFKN